LKEITTGMPDKGDMWDGEREGKKRGIQAVRVVYGAGKAQVEVRFVETTVHAYLIRPDGWGHTTFLAFFRRIRHLSADPSRIARSGFENY
jgi:hypothetical protein